MGRSIRQGHPSQVQGLHMFKVGDKALPSGGLLCPLMSIKEDQTGSSSAGTGSATGAGGGKALHVAFRPIVGHGI